MKAGRTVLLSIATLVIFPLLQAVPVADDAEALRLLRQAGVARTIREDLQESLQLLKRAAETAQSDSVRGRVLVETALVRWMRLESPLVIRKLLVQATALIGPPGTEHAQLPGPFRRVWKSASRGKVSSGIRKKRFQVDVTATGMASADSRFAAAYGRWQFMPEARLSVTVYKGWKTWVSYSSFTFSSMLPVIGVELNGFQRFTALGLAWERSLGRRLSFSLYGGIEWAAFKEQATAELVQDTCLGFRAGTGLKWRISPTIHVLTSLGYGFVSKDIGGGRSLRPDGLRLSTGLGIRF
ncbi:MAG TPA: hypothetical protein ENN40_10975 [Candidatus Aminicenantes bacterium]|nr:hypothetical protein [Candidatus Aminicenantes bacterium]